MGGKPGFVLILFLTFFGQNQGFCSYKIVLIKTGKRVWLLYTNILFSCKYETLEKIGYVIFYTDFN